MWLRSGDHSVLVSPQGGSILQWQYKEHTILGPARMVRVGDELKMRGETHWCYPNFGAVKPEIAAPWRSYPQHGVLRKNRLSIVHWSDTLARFRATPLRDGERVVSRPTVSIMADPLGVKAHLRITNDSEERIPILPAIHPYFALPRQGLRLIVGSMDIWSGNIPSNDHPTEDMIFYCGGHPFSVILHGIGRVDLQVSHDCSYLVVWSDNSSEYICIEPVFGKPETFGTEDGRWLDPGEAVECFVDFRFTPD